MLYNIIGDIHCRRNWRELVREDCVNVFVGDYFAPYRHEFDASALTFDYEASVFYEIMEYKARHPETVTLIGNHDLEHWKLLGKDFTNRFDEDFYKLISQVLGEFEDELQIVTSLDGKGIVTHAGVSAVWYENMVSGGFRNRVIDLRPDGDVNDPDGLSKALDAFHGEYSALGIPFRNIDQYILFRWHDGYYKKDECGNLTRIRYDIDKVVSEITGLWKDGKYTAFRYMTASPGDSRSGDNVCNGPTWIRPHSLCDANIFAGTGYCQFAGHTKFYHPTIIKSGNDAASGTIKDTMSCKDEDFICLVDCLGLNTESVIFDSEQGTVRIARPVR